MNNSILLVFIKINLENKPRFILTSGKKCGAYYYLFSDDKPLKCKYDVSFKLLHVHHHTVSFRYASFLNIVATLNSFNCESI